MSELCDLLDKVAILWQVKDYDRKVNSILLAEWIMDNYQHSDLELVRLALSKPPLGDDREWRLTPDTIKNWIDLTRFKRAEARERKESLERQTREDKVEPLTPEQEKRIFDLLNEAKANIQKVPNPKKGDIQKIIAQDKERQEGKKSVVAAIGYQPMIGSLIVERERLDAAARSRGLHKANFNELKRYDVLDRSILARSQKEAESIWQEVYGDV